MKKNWLYPNRRLGLCGLVDIIVCSMENVNFELHSRLATSRSSLEVILKDAISLRVCINKKGLFQNCVT